MPKKKTNKKMRATKKKPVQQQPKKRYLLGGLLTLFSIGSFFLILGVLVFLLGIYHYGQDLPDYKQLKEYKPSITTRLYAGDGTMIAEYASEKRIFVPIQVIPKHVVYAFLSAEDKNFFAHKGIDVYGILRAIVNNINNIRQGRRLEGASTITQQVAKNFLLTNEVSFDRKIKEAILAFRMEKAFSKNHLLELYLNEIYLGNRSFGVAAAALNYFDKSLDELSLEEAALLAALPKAPSRFDPFRNPERAKIRRDWVLERMATDGRVSEEQAEQAQLKPIDLQGREQSDFAISRYFAEDVRRELLDDYGEETLYLGGLSVRTTMDPRLQRIARNVLRDGLESYDRRHGYRGPYKKIKNLDHWQEELKAIPKPVEALSEWKLAVVLRAMQSKLVIGFKDGTKGVVKVEDISWARKPLKRGLYLGDPITAAYQVTGAKSVIFVKKADGKNSKEDEYYLRQVPEVQGGLVALDPHTGRILAMQGGYNSLVSSFNRVTQAKRQPGSAFKPIVYLAALDEGFTPSNLILDAPFVIDQGPGLPKWKPHNYSKEFYGPTPIRVGVEKSRNLMTVRLANHIGMDKIADYAKRFGVTENLPKVLSMSLGAGETTLMNLTSAYAVLVNGGKKIDPSMIDRIQDREGKTVYKHDDRKCKNCSLLLDWQAGQETPEIEDNRAQIADPRTAYQIVSMMEGVVQRGTATRLKSLNRPVAGKTGTTNQSKDAWFLGFTPNLVVGVYIGFDDPRPLGKRETGSSVAAPVFKDFMEEAMKDVPAQPFRIPEGINLVKINRTTGQPAMPEDDEKDLIWEAFLPGTEPTTQQYILDKSGLNLLVGQDATTVKDSAAIGTGGLY